MKAFPISPCQWEPRDERKLTHERRVYSDPASPTISEETLSSGSDEDDFGSSDELLGDAETGCISPRSLSPRTSHFERPLNHGSGWIPIPCGPPSPSSDHPGDVMTPKASSPSGFIALPIPPTPTKRRSRDWEAFINGPAPPCLYECPEYPKSLQLSSSSHSTPFLIPSTPTKPSRKSEALVKREERGKDRESGDKYREGIREVDDDDADDLRVSPRLLWRRDDEKMSVADDPFL